jgi:hypothetical protein
VPSQNEIAPSHELLPPSPRIRNPSNISPLMQDTNNGEAMAVGNSLVACLFGRA